MTSRIKDLANAVVRRQLGRRDFMRRAGQLGIGAGAATYFLNQAQSTALAQDFDWQKHSGTTVKLLLEQASLCRCDDRQSRDLQGDDGHGGHL